ncbi:hypothetical protein D7V81_05945 [bacterium 1XD21-70]|nr:hypothetical protein D7V81_05945 [bacterium 1XD21-70]
MSDLPGHDCSEMGFRFRAFCFWQRRASKAVEESLPEGSAWRAKARYPVDGSSPAGYFLLPAMDGSWQEEREGEGMWKNRIL